MIDITTALPTFAITLREGVEAALVVGIVLAYLKKAGQSHLNAWVFSGIGAGIGASVLVGAIFWGILHSLEASHQAVAPVLKQGLEGVFSLGAIALLSWMLVWMTRQARTLKAELEGTLNTTLQQSGQSGWGVFGLVAIAVLREGFETVLFLAAQFQQGWMPTLGAIAGLVAATGIGVLLFRFGVKINLRLFFQTMGVLLLLIVSGLVITALRHFDAALGLLAQQSPSTTTFCPSHSGSCILGPLVWDASPILPDRQFPGIVLKAFFGYTQRLYLVQAIAYVLFLVTIGGLYLHSIGISLPRWQSPQVSQGD